MKRVTERELMENEIQAEAYANADFNEPHSNFIKLFSTFIKNHNLTGAHILDLGCGTGDITFRFARAFESTFVDGIDGSEAMLAYGKKMLLQEASINNRVKLIKEVLPTSNVQGTKYDAIISNSLLHHFHNPNKFWEVVKSFARSGTPIFIMDLRRVKTIDVAKKLRDRYAINEPDILKHDFFHSLLAAFEKEEIIDQLHIAKLEHLLVDEVGDRHIVIKGYML